MTNYDYHTVLGLTCVSGLQCSVVATTSVIFAEYNGAWLFLVHGVICMPEFIQILLLPITTKVYTNRLYNS